MVELVETLGKRDENEDKAHLQRIARQWRIRYMWYRRRRRGRPEL